MIKDHAQIIKQLTSMAHKAEKGAGISPFVIEVHEAIDIIESLYDSSIKYSQLYIERGAELVLANNEMQRLKDQVKQAKQNTVNDIMRIALDHIE